METPLIRTKLLVPPLRDELVARPRLFERLDAGLRPGHKLTLVSAPAGYGKTTLVAAWLKRARTGLGAPGPARVAWLSLDEHDDNLARFLAYLLAALQAALPAARPAVDPGIGQAVQGLLHVPVLPPVEALLAPLINDLLPEPAPAEPAPLVLVLDDLHASTFPELYPALEFWLDHAPRHVHTTLITRQDPPLPLARWRARGQLTELRQRDLCFGREETGDLLRSMGLTLPDAEVARLGERTEGWIAGLQMAALALRHAVSGEAAEILSGFSGRHHYILDYLTDEVLRRQPPHVRAFLLRTCILDQMCGPLCAELTSVASCASRAGVRPEGEAQSTLEHLERANLFVVPMDRERTWYRYHRLFAELLRARLRAERSDEIPGLHRRAATWYEREGWGTLAVQHALQTGDAAWATELVERVLEQQTTVSRLDAAALLAWLAALPQEQVHARPRLQVLRARAYYVTGRRDQAERTLDDLEEKLRAAPASPGAQAQLASIAADRASYAAMRGEVRRALAWAQPALAAAKAAAGTRALAQLRPASVLGLAHQRAGNVAEAGPAFERAIAVALEAGVAIAAVPLLCNLAEVRFVQGKLRQALACCDRAETLAAEALAAGASPDPAVQEGWGTGFVHAMRAKVAYERRDLDAAAAHARQAAEQLQQGHVTLGQETLYGLQSRIEQARGKVEAANAALERAAQLARGNDVPRLISFTAAVQARVHLAQGEIHAATRWADEYTRQAPTEYLREFEDLTLARVWLARGQPDAALDLLERLLPSAQEAGRWGPAIEALALRALGLHATGRPKEAASCLSLALGKAHPEGYVRPFSECGEPMRELLLHVSERSDADEATRYAAQLLAAFAPPRRKASTANILPSSPLIEPLTARERDVLGLLAQGLTNAEIGRQLVISLPTVKSHTRNLYGKLGVHNRRSAVVRAQELGLLNDSYR